MDKERETLEIALSKTAIERLDRIANENGHTRTEEAESLLECVCSPFFRFAMFGYRTE